MARAQRKTELSPVEALIVERRLHDEARATGANGVQARIQALTNERRKLWAQSASHPFLAAMNRDRVLAISVEIEALWGELRRQRAGRRAQLERALNVEDEDNTEPHHEPEVVVGSIGAA